MDSSLQFMGLIFQIFYDLAKNAWAQADWKSKLDQEISTIFTCYSSHISSFISKFIYQVSEDIYTWFLRSYTYTVSSKFLTNIVIIFVRNGEFFENGGHLYSFMKGQN